MVKQTIEIFCRLKPPSQKSKLCTFEVDKDGEENPRLTFHVPKELSEGLVNNKKESHRFRYDKIFDITSKQDDIFIHVAKPVIDNVLSGYNGTIFAYGQTGSGKTFTITGGAERYDERGIIPRTLQYLFEQFAKNQENEYTTSVSYLEIYNEHGYDLLNENHSLKLDDLPKVTLLEDSNNEFHLKNLSIHSVSKEEDALEMLFLGDTNRAVAETPMNDASTRSHCIFTIHLCCRQIGSATLRRAKLHLVDLAGSERVSKTGTSGLQLKEAKYINLSLHYLEQVIVALSEKHRGHVPYRNSMMTSVLRDSLGGNCRTTMIATCSVERRNLDESISTCRFAQRVALIKNDAVLNEEMDPLLLIARLKRDIEQLKSELALATGQSNSLDALTEEEVALCRETIMSYLRDADEGALVAWFGSDMRKILACFSQLRSHATAINEAHIADKDVRNVKSTSAYEPYVFENPVYNKEVRQLQDLLTQRDNELKILVDMLREEKRRSAQAEAKLERVSNDRKQFGGHEQSIHKSESFSSLHSASTEQSRASVNVALSKPPSGRSDRPSTANSTSSSKASQKLVTEAEHQSEQRIQGRLLGDMSAGRSEAFEIFKRDYYHNEEIQSLKDQLRGRYTAAKQLGIQVNTAKNAVNECKGRLETLRKQVALGVREERDAETEMTTQRIALESASVQFQNALRELKSLKSEIEHLQHLLERWKGQLAKDFNNWWTNRCQTQESAESVARQSWFTPPVTPQQSTYQPASQRRAPLPNIHNSDQIEQTNSTLSISGVPQQQLTGDPEIDAIAQDFYRMRARVAQAHLARKT